MDLLEQMLEKQTEFTKKVIRKNYGKEIEEMTWDDKQHFMKDLVLNIVSECIEFLREIKWKSHRNVGVEFNRKAASIELVDVSKFLLNFLIILNLSAHEFSAFWNEKHEIVLERWLEEYGEKYDQPVKKEE